MKHQSRGRFTTEFKVEAVRLVKAGQSISMTAKVLGVSIQTLHNWVQRDKLGKLKGAGSKPVSDEQMEIARLRAEVARLKMERDILKKATAYFAKDVV
jgi:transposase